MIKIGYSQIIEKGVIESREGQLSMGKIEYLSFVGRTPSFRSCTE